MCHAPDYSSGSRTHSQKEREQSNINIERISVLYINRKRQSCASKRAIWIEKKDRDIERSMYKVKMMSLNDR